MIIPTGFGQANFLFEGTGAPLGAQCTIGFEDETGDSPTAVAEAMWNLWVGSILEGQTQDVSLVATQVKFGPNDTGNFGEYFDSAPGEGTGASCSPQVSFLVRKITGSGGRTGRGRMYLPGVAEAVVDESGNIPSIDVTAMNDRLDVFRAGLISMGAVPHLLHAETGAGSAMEPFLIQLLRMDSKVATQRKRLRG